jgi:chemotaxis response regulator CheB
MRRARDADGMKPAIDCRAAMDNFKIVVIGASQGGLEALERMVAKLPGDPEDESHN